MKKEINRFFRKYKKIFLMISLFGIFVDIFLFTSISDLLILFLAGFWLLSVWSNEFEARVSILGGLITLVICPLLLVFGKAQIAEKAAVWAYMLLLIGSIQMFIGNFRKREEYESEK